MSLAILVVLDPSAQSAHTALLGATAYSHTSSEESPTITSEVPIDSQYICLRLFREFPPKLPQSISSGCGALFTCSTPSNQHLSTAPTQLAHLELLSSAAHSFLWLLFSNVQLITIELSFGVGLYPAPSVLAHSAAPLCCPLSTSLLPSLHDSAVPSLYVSVILSVGALLSRMYSLSILRFFRSSMYSINFCCRYVYHCLLL